MFSDERLSRMDLYDTLDLAGLLKLERKSPRDVDLLVSIGREYLHQRRLDLCHSYYSRALAIDPEDGWTRLYMGNLFFALACYDEAVAEFQKAMELLPDVSCPHWCLAEVYAKQGYWSRTEHHFRRAVEVDPSGDDAKRKLEAWLAERVSDAHQEG